MPTHVETVSGGDHVPNRLDHVPEVVAGETSPSVSEQLRRKLLYDPNPISDYLIKEPPEVAWVVSGLIAERLEAGLVAPGGTGKGLFTIGLGAHLSLGQDFGPFAVPKPRGVLLLSFEDDEDVLHRRVRAAFDANFDNLTDEQREGLERRFYVQSLRGYEGATLSNEFVEVVCEAAERIDDCALIIIDPLARVLHLPDGSTLNSQEGAGQTLNVIGRIVQRTGCSVIFVHHVNKRAIQEGQELYATAATGSQQLVDLSRLVINMRKLGERNRRTLGLEEGSYVEMKISKSNGPVWEDPVIFRIAEGGALVYVEAPNQEAVDDSRALEALEELGEPATRDQWEEACGELDPPLAQRRARHARTRLEARELVLRDRGAEGGPHLFRLNPEPPAV